MDGRQKPDPQPENKNDLNDDEIIDLTQVIQEKDNDDIIDLTEVLEQPEKPAASSEDQDAAAAIPLTEAAATDEAPTGSEEDDEIIDLMDVATTLESEIPATEDDVPKPPVEKIATPDDAEEEILDLSQVATVVDSDAAAASQDAPTEDVAEPVEEDEPIDLLEVATAPDSQAPQEDGLVSDTTDGDEGEEIIDLTDVAAATDEVPSAPEAQPSEMAATEASAADQIDDEMIALTDVAADEQPVEMFEAIEDESSMTATTAELDDDEFADLESRADAILADTVEPLDAPVEGTDTEAMFAPVPPLEAPAPIEAASLTDEQVEAALTQVIEKVYGEKIEQLMLQTIEKTVKREIEKIKSALLGPGDGLDR